MMQKWCLTRYLAGVPRQTDQYFTCRARRFLSGAGVLQSLTVVPGTDGVLGTIELDPNDDIDALPDGIYAQVAVYSDHFSHVSVMRKVLLRMTSWMHYLYLDH